MARAFQGFTIAKNLAESTLDNDVLSNLAGQPIGNDITLLFNNTRNTSVISVASENISGASITFTDPNVLSVFSNKTRVTVGTSIYYVKNSNGVNVFQLSSKSDLTDTVSSPPVGLYIRSDEVTAENLSNYSAVRREVSGKNSQTGADTFFTEGVSVLLGGDTPKTLLGIIDSNIDAYRFRTSKTLSTISDFTGSKPLLAAGTVIIKDPDNINVGGFSNSTPGLFIYDKVSSSVIRAFSSNQNPWEGLTEYLECKSTEITVNNLVLENTTAGISLQLKDPTIKSTSTATAVRANYTHKLPIKINGELFYLCLKL